MPFLLKDRIDRVREKFRALWNSGRQQEVSPRVTSAPSSEISRQQHVIHIPVNVLSPVSPNQGAISIQSQQHTIFLASASSHDLCLQLTSCMHLTSIILHKSPRHAFHSADAQNCRCESGTGQSRIQSPRARRCKYSSRANGLSDRNVTGS